MTLSTLLAHLQTATEDDQAEVLAMAFVLFVEALPEAIGNPSWLELIDGQFQHMLEAKAYESAALLIMREVLPECGWTLAGPFAPKSFSCASVHVAGQEFEGDAGTPDLAIIAAICAAKGDGDVA